jgi:hypothetical protein
MLLPNATLATTVWHVQKNSLSLVKRASLVILKECALVLGILATRVGAILSFPLCIVVATTEIFVLCDALVAQWYLSLAR